MFALMASLLCSFFGTKSRSLLSVTNVLASFHWLCHMLQTGLGAKLIFSREVTAECNILIHEVF